MLISCSSRASRSIFECSHHNEMQAKYIVFPEPVYHPISGSIWLMRRLPLRCLRLKILESAFFLYFKRLRFEARNIPKESKVMSDTLDWV